MVDREEYSLLIRQLSRYYEECDEVYYVLSIRVLVAIPILAIIYFILATIHSILYLHHYLLLILQSTSLLLGLSVAISYTLIIISWRKHVDRVTLFYKTLSDLLKTMGIQGIEFIDKYVNKLLLGTRRPSIYFLLPQLILVLIMASSYRFLSLGAFLVYNGVVYTSLYFFNKAYTTHIGIEHSMSKSISSVISVDEYIGSRSLGITEDVEKMITLLSLGLYTYVLLIKMHSMLREHYNQHRDYETKLLLQLLK